MKLSNRKSRINGTGCQVQHGMAASVCGRLQASYGLRCAKGAPGLPSASRCSIQTQATLQAWSTTSPSAKSAPTAAPSQHTARAAVIRLFDALNRRDVSTLLGLLAEGATYDSLAASVAVQGREAVARFYLDALSGLPEEAAFVLDDTTDGSGMQVGVAWHLELKGNALPLSRTIGLYSVDARGQLLCLRDSPEHAVKLSLPTLTLVAPPLLRGLGPWARQISGVHSPGDGSTSDGGLLGTVGSALQALGSAAASVAGSGSTGTLMGGSSSREGSLFGLQLPFLSGQAGGGSGVHASSSSDGAIAARAHSSALTAASVAGGKSRAGTGVTASSSSIGQNIRMRSLSDADLQPGQERLAVGTSAPSAAPAAPDAVYSYPVSSYPSADSDDVIDVAVAVVHPQLRAPVLASSKAGGGSAATGAAGGVGQGRSLPGRSTATNVNLTGLWEKDPAASQLKEYEELLDLLGLGGIQKVTARLIDGLDIKQAQGKLEVSFVTVVPFFRVTETSKFGESSFTMRRDLRMGRQSTIAERVPGGASVTMRWDNPLAGSLREDYALLGDDGNMMEVTSTLTIGAKTATAAQVYRRSNVKKSDLLAAKLSSYGSMEDVIRKQEETYGKTV